MWDLWQTSLLLLAFALALGAEKLYRKADDSAWRVFATPFWRLALLSTVPLLLAGLAWGFLGGIKSRVFFFSLALNWWLGGLLFTLATRRYRLQIIGLAAALAFPIAMGVSEYWYFGSQEISVAWYALGWAILVPVYWLAGRWLQERFWSTEDELDRTYGRMVLVVGGLLVMAAGLSSLINTSAATVVHLVLAAAMLMAAIMWQQPRLMWGMSLFLLSGSAAWQASLGATPPQLALPWALLSILHIIIALRVDKASPADPSPNSSRGTPNSPSETIGRGGWATPNERQKSSLPEERQRKISSNLCLPLYEASVFLAGLAILPPLFFFDHSLLAYALGNWIGVNGWLAYLGHGTDAPGLRALLAGCPRRWSRLPRPLLFHWLAALPILPWLWLNWTNGREPSASLALAYAILGWGLLGLCVRLRRMRWAYGRPWQVAAHLSNMVALGTGFVYYDQPWWASTLLLVAAFYFTAARILYQRGWLVAAGFIFLFAWLIGLEWLEVPNACLYAAAALLVLAYVVVPAWLVQRRGVRVPFVQPLYDVALLIAGLLFLPTLGATLIWWDRPEELMWIAATQVILAISFTLYSWLGNQVLWGHIAVWLAVYGAGLVVKTYGSGSGRSAALAALMALVYVLTERALHQLALTPRGPHKIPVTLIRRAWRLFRRPLLLAAWMISLGAIGAALLRNMIWLAGGVTRQIWAIIALLIITGLYALSARLFHKIRFVWFASILAFFPWTLATDLIRWYVLEWPSPAWYGPSWMVLALLGLSVGVVLALKLFACP